MIRRLQRTRSALAVSAAIVAIVSFFTFRRANDDVFVACSGDLVVEHDAYEPAGGTLPRAPTGDYRIEARARWDRTGRARYDRVRVVASREGDLPACNDVAVPWDRSGDPEYALEVRVLGEDRYAVTGPVVGGRYYGSPETLVVFHRDARAGRRFVAKNLASPSQLPTAVTLVAVAALVVGLFRARRAAAYATRMHAWTEARLRPDGLLESESGMALGTVDRGARVRAGAVIVDRACLEGHDVYRGLPVVVRGRIAAGSHERWASGTLRRMRDAQTLAVIASLVAGAACLARLLG